MRRFAPLAGLAVAAAALLAAPAPARAADDDTLQKMMREMLADRNAFTFIQEVGLAEVDCMQFNLVAAVDKYTAVIAKMEKAYGPNSLVLANPLQNRGMILQRIRRFAEAEHDFRTALAITRTAREGKNRMAAQAMVNLSGLLLDTGRPQEAEKLLAEAVGLYAEHKWPDDVTLACGVHHQGLLRLMLGRPRQALEAFDRALPITVKACGARSLEAGNAHQSRATALIQLGRTKEAIAALEDAIAAYKSLMPKTSIETVGALTALGWVYTREGRSDDARKQFELGDKIAAGAARIMPDLQNMIRVAQDELALFRADWDGLEKRFAARPPVERGFGTWVDYVDRHHLGQLHAYRGRWDKATAQFDTVCRELHALSVNTLPGLTELEQLSYSATLSRVRDGGLSIAAAAPPDAGVADKTAEWAVNLKNLPLRVAAAQQRLRAAEVERPWQALAIRTHTVQLDRVRAEMTGLAFARPVAPLSGRWDDRYKQLLADEADLSARLARLTGDSVRVPKWTPLADVRAGLAPTGTALVEIVRCDAVDYLEKPDAVGLKRVTRPRYLAWVIPPAPAAVTFHDLGPADAIDAAVQKVLKHADGIPIDADLKADEPEFGKHLAALSKLVLDPLYPALKGYPRWAVCPDGAVWLVPWSALPAGKEFVAERHAVRLLTSGADARDLGRPKLNFARGGPAVVLADPDFNLALGSGPRAGEKLRRPDGFAEAVEGLKATQRDADAAVKGLTRLTGRAPVQLLGREATEARLRGAESPAVLVASTHAFAIGGGETAGNRGVTVAPFGVEPLVSPPPEGGYRNPLRGAGLILAGYNTALARDGVTFDNDGLLHALDIPALKFDGTELVLLPCCETGRGAVYADGGVASLCTAFGVAGARTVSGTLWRVRDDATADLMAAFFDQLAVDSDPAEALALAQQSRLAALRKAGSPAHPLLWAGFFVSGPTAR
jgi:tetratricopeptide (TPR) repeat protein